MGTPESVLREIESLLWDSSGGHRDLDLEDLSWPGIQALFDALQPEFTGVSVGASSEDTEAAQVQDCSSALRSVERGRGSAQLLFSGGRAWLTHLQFFVSHDGSAGYGLQLTFFPRDVAQPRPDASAFMAWVHWVRQTARASRACIRDHLLVFMDVDGEPAVSMATT